MRVHASNIDMGFVTTHIPARYVLDFLYQSIPCDAKRCNGIIVLS